MLPWRKTNSQASSDVSPLGSVKYKDDKGLILENISKIYDKDRGKVLDSVNLEIKPRSFFALLGPSGCGKSTLLRIIAGLEYHDSGNVILGDVDVTQFPPQSRPVNMVFQTFALFPHFTVFDNISFGLMAKGMKKTDYTPIVKEAIESLRLSGLENVYPDQLSGGQQQRVALARALVNKPRVLLLDEPMSHLDDYLKAKVGQDLRNLQESLGTIFIMVTHDREDAMAISTDMAILNEGKIAQIGKPKTIFSKPLSTFVARFMGKGNVFPAKKDSKYGNVAHLPFCEVKYDDTLAWDETNVLINPENIRILSSGEKLPSSAAVEIKGNFVRARYRGYNVEIVVKVPNGNSNFPGKAPEYSHLQILASPGDEADWENNALLTLYVDPKEIVNFEPGNLPSPAAQENLETHRTDANGSFMPIDGKEESGLLEEDIRLRASGDS
jgi:ABC-type Fe3+/spermidine/putrescine transport system ATPase subunit